MADTTETSLLVIQTSNQGTDDAAASVKALGTNVDKTSQSVDAMNARTAAQQASLSSWSSTLDTASNHLGDISAKLDLTSRAASTAGLAFDSIGWDPVSTGAAQLSGRLDEVSSGFELLSKAASVASDAIGTQRGALDQAADQYSALSDAQSDATESSTLSTAAWIAAGAAALALAGVTAGLVIGVTAAASAMDDAATAAETWAVEMATGGILDNMQKLIDAGNQLSDLSTTTGIAAENFSILATGLQGSGMSAETTKDLLTNLAETLNSTSSQAVAARASMADLGIDVQKVGKNGNDVQAVFLAVAHALSQYQDGAEKTALAQQLLGSSSAEVINGLDAANSAYGRMDSQVRTNIANTAAYVAQVQQLIATYKDLRDNSSATLFQSQVSSGAAQIGGGWQQFAAGLNGGSGLFSAGGRQKMGAGLSDIGSGISEIDSSIELQVSDAALVVGEKIDQIFGTKVAAAVQDHIDDVVADINATAAKATPDMRSAMGAPAEGTAAWASSASTTFMAQYDTGTAALQKFSTAYAGVIDALSRGVITDDQAAEAVGKLTDAYAKAIDTTSKFDQWAKQQTAVQDIKSQYAPGADRDKALALQQASQLPGYDEGKAGQIIDDQQSQDALDKLTAATKQQQQAFADLHQKTADAASDSEAVAEAWSRSAEAGLLAEAQTSALADARGIDKNAAASQADVVNKLTASYNDALKDGAQYIQQLKDQAAAAAAAAAAGADPASQSQAAITAQVDARLKKQLQLAQVLDQEQGTSDNTLAVMEMMTTAAAQLANTHDSQIETSLKAELASQQDQITAARTQLDYATKNSAEAKISLATENERARLRAMGVTDLQSEEAQLAINNAADLAAVNAEAAARQKAYQQQVSEVAQNSEDLPSEAEQTCAAMIMEVFKCRS